MFWAVKEMTVSELFCSVVDLCLDRCDACWHMRPICICTSLPQVALRADIELVVYMDSKVKIEISWGTFCGIMFREINRLSTFQEVYNSGDDAKLLSIICPNQTKRYLLRRLVLVGSSQRFFRCVACYA